MFAFHPRPNDQGQPVRIQTPSQATTLETWSDPSAVATCRPNGLPPMRLNGLLLATASLDDVVHADIEEPAFAPPSGIKAAAGAVVVEPDGRVWVVHPTNGFGGYLATFADAGRHAPANGRARGVRRMRAGGGGVRLPGRLEALKELHALLPRAPRGRFASRYGMGEPGSLVGAAGAADGDPQSAGRSRDRGGASGTGGRMGRVVWGAGMTAVSAAILVAGRLERPE